MRKGKIIRFPEGNNKNGTQKSSVVVSPIEDTAVQYEVIFPWFLRGAMGKNLKAGDEIVFEVFCDGSGYCVGRADGTWGEVIPAAELILGKQLGSDPLVLAYKLKAALENIKTHTHPVAETTATASAELQTMDSDCGAEYVKGA